MTNKKFRQNFDRLLKKYDKYATGELKKVFSEWAKQLDYTDPKAAQLNDEVLKQALFNIYFYVGDNHIKYIVNSVNADIKAVSPFSFLDAILYFMNMHGHKKIVSITQTFIKAVKAVIIQAAKENITGQLLTDRVHRAVSNGNFYNWQAERIARTETIAAANYAAVYAGDELPFEAEKVWISAHDDRTRRNPPSQFDHLEMDGVTTGRFDPFMLWDYDENKYELLMFPGDPAGSAANVIQCRCAVSLRPKRDVNGNIIMKGDKPRVDPSNILKPAKFTAPGQVQQVLSTLEEFEASIVGDKYETAGIFDPDTGKLIYKHTQKNKKSVSFTLSQLKKLEGKILTHNHPSGGSFSANDIYLATKYRLNEIRAVGDKYIHTITFTDADAAELMAETLYKSYNYYRKKVAKEWSARYWKGEMTEAYFKEHVTDEIVKRVLTQKKRNKIVLYERKLRKGFNKKR